MNPTARKLTALSLAAVMAWAWPPALWRQRKWGRHRHRVPYPRHHRRADILRRPDRGRHYRRAQVH